MKNFRVTYNIVEEDSDFMTSTTISNFSTEISADSWEDLKQKTIAAITEEESDDYMNEFIMSQMDYLFDQDKFKEIFNNDKDFYFFTDSDSIKWVTKTTTLTIRHI